MAAAVGTAETRYNLIAVSFAPPVLFGPAAFTFSYGTAVQCNSIKIGEFPEVLHSGFMRFRLQLRV
jgi:hypothetical protein